MKNLIITIAALTVLALNNLKAQNNIPLSINNEDGNISLEWNTQKEVNSSYFVIESSNDNLNFCTIAKVKAAGYSVNSKSYQLESVSQGLYYRVTLVNMEGERNSSLVVNGYANNYGTALSVK